MVLMNALFTLITSLLMSAILVTSLMVFVNGVNTLQALNSQSVDVYNLALLIDQVGISKNNVTIKTRFKHPLIITDYLIISDDVTGLLMINSSKKNITLTNGWVNIE